MIGLDSVSTVIIAMLIDIGVAPDHAKIGNEMRSRIYEYDQDGTNLEMTREIAIDFAKYLKIGLIRHETGIKDPEDVILH